MCPTRSGSNDFKTKKNGNHFECRIVIEQGTLNPFPVDLSECMNIEVPPALQELARQSLLRNESLLVFYLEDLPWSFSYTFTGTH